MADPLYDALMKVYGMLPSEESMEQGADMASYLLGGAAPAGALRGIYQGLMGQKTKDEALQRLLEREGGPPEIHGKTSLKADRDMDLGSMAHAGKFLLARILPKLIFKGVGGVPMFIPGGR